MVPRELRDGFLLHEFLDRAVSLAERAFVRERVDGVVTGPTHRHRLRQASALEAGRRAEFPALPLGTREDVVTRELRLALAQRAFVPRDDVALVVGRGRRDDGVEERRVHVVVVVVILPEEVEEDVFPTLARGVAVGGDARVRDVAAHVFGRERFPNGDADICLLYTSPSPRDVEESRMPSSA